MKKDIYLVILIVFLLLFLDNTLVASDETIFQTSIFSFSNINNQYNFDIYVAKKNSKQDVYFEFFLRVKSKIFINLDSSNFEIKTDRNFIKLNKVKKSYKSNFDSANNLWLEEIFLNCTYDDFQKFYKAATNFLIIKSYLVSITVEIPKEFKKIIDEYSQYSKAIGLDIEKKSLSKLYIGFVNYSFPNITIFSPNYSSYLNIAANTSFLPYSAGAIGIINPFYNFSLILPINFFIFSSLNLNILYFVLPFSQKDSTNTYFFSFLELFVGFNIKLFKLFNFLTFSLNFAPGVFFTFIYDKYQNIFYPQLVIDDFIIVLLFIGLQSSVNVDFNISENFTLRLAFINTFNIYGVVSNSINIISIIGL